MNATKNTMSTWLGLAITCACLFLVGAFASSQEASLDRTGSELAAFPEEDRDLDGILDYLKSKVSESAAPAPAATDTDKVAATDETCPRDDGWLIGMDWGVEHCDAWEVDEANGDCAWIGVTGFHGLNSAARDRYGRIYSVEDNTCYGISGDLLLVDPETGAGTFRATLDFGDITSDIRALAFSPDDVLYAIDNRTPCRIDSDDLWIIDRESGVGTLVGPTGLWSVQGLAFSPEGVLYGWDLDVGLVTLDTETGAATVVNPSVEPVAYIQTLTFCPDGRLFGLNSELWQISPDDGTQVRVGTETYSDLRGVEFVLPYLPLDVDVEPHNDADKVNPNSNRVIEVAVLGNEVMAALEVDPASLRFGPWEAEPAHDLSNQAILVDHFADVNGDMRADLVVHFYTQETGISCGDTAAKLKGQLKNGKLLEGEGPFVTQGCD